MNTMYTEELIQVVHDTFLPMCDYKNESMNIQSKDDLTANLTFRESLVVLLARLAGFWTALSSPAKTNCSGSRYSSAKRSRYSKRISIRANDSMWKDAVLGGVGPDGLSLHPKTGGRNGR